VRVNTNIQPFQGKELGRRYKALPPEELAKWQAKADKDKEAYKVEMAEYVKNKAGKSSPLSRKLKTPEPESSSDDDSDVHEDDSGDSDSD